MQNLLAIKEYSGEVTMCGYPPPSYVTNYLQFWWTPFPLPSDIIFKSPLKEY